MGKCVFHLTGCSPSSKESKELKAGAWNPNHQEMFAISLVLSFLSSSVLSAQSGTINGGTIDITICQQRRKFLQDMPLGQPDESTSSIGILSSRVPTFVPSWQPAMTKITEDWPPQWSLLWLLMGTLHYVQRWYHYILLSSPLRIYLTGFVNHFSKRWLLRKVNHLKLC